MQNENLTFGDALISLKEGKKVARQGWNGKGMWLRMCPAMNYSILFPSNEVEEVLPWIGMKTADNKFVPWLASQTDVLAEDWQIV